jgi:epoxyqueuosine reductase
MNRTATRRADVRNVVPGARSVIMTGTLYNTDRPYSNALDPGAARISRYAWGDDYHTVIGHRLDALLSWMREASPESFEARAYVDTGPVQERVYAQHAGVGWIGKNSCVINPELGSWVFLGAIICSLPLGVDAPSLDQCGTCTLCLEACPTQALVAPGVLDSTRCISYLTIELRGDIPEDHRAAIGSHVYGCDICQEVCPWNAAAPRSVEPAWQPRTAWDRVDLLTLSRRSDDELTVALRGSPMKRTKVQGLRRNVALALQNAQTAEPDRG